MARVDTDKLEGVIVEALLNALYRVELESKEKIVAYLSREPRRNFIRLLIGDRVYGGCVAS